MKIFVIGASGYVGSQVTRSAVAAGHQVIGLTRSEKGCAAITDFGATPLIGDATDLPTMQAAMLATDATIFAPQIASQDDEKDIVVNMLATLQGTGKTFIFTSGTGVLGQRTEGEWSEDSFAEDEVFVTSKYLTRRCETELAVRSAATFGVRSMVIRPPLIWGCGYHGFVDLILRSIEKTGDACFIGAGRNLYTQVHVEDLADLYVLAVEKGAAGALYHAASGELNNRSIAEYVAHQQGVETRSVSMSEAMEVWDKFTALIVLGVSSRSRSPRSRSELGWTPTRLDLAEQILTGRLTDRR